MISGLNGDREIINQSNVKEFVFNLMPQHMLQRSQEAPSYEKQQNLPSFHKQLKMRTPKSL